MKCPECGIECADKAAFCDWCGAKLHADAGVQICEPCKYTFPEALADYWANAFDFEGRARRKEFWYACIWNFAFAIVIAFIGMIVSHDLQFALEVVFYAGVFIPNISLAVRRVHDIGKSGLWLFIGFVPILGHVALAVIFALDSERKENKYGKSTKYTEHSSVI